MASQIKCDQGTLKDISDGAVNILHSIGELYQVSPLLCFTLIGTFIFIACLLGFLYNKKLNIYLIKLTWDLNKIKRERE